MHFTKCIHITFDFIIFLITTFCFIKLQMTDVSDFIYHAFIYYCYYF